MESTVVIKTIWIMFKAHRQRVRIDGREGGDGKYFHSAHFITKEMSVWPENKSS